jgi:hypothetical protein
LDNTLGRSQTTHTQKVFGYVLTGLKGLFFIEELITKKGLYHLFEVEVEVLRFVFYHTFLVKVTCSFVHVDYELAKNLARWFCYHLKELHCSAQCLTEDEDVFVKGLRSLYTFGYMF